MTMLAAAAGGGAVVILLLCAAVYMVARRRRGRKRASKRLSRSASGTPHSSKRPNALKPTGAAPPATGGVALPSLTKQGSSGGVTGRARGRSRVADSWAGAAEACERKSSGGGYTQLCEPNSPVVAMSPDPGGAGGEKPLGVPVGMTATDVGSDRTLSVDSKGEWEDGVNPRLDPRDSERTEVYKSGGNMSTRADSRFAGYDSGRTESFHGSVRGSTSLGAGAGGVGGVGGGGGGGGDGGDVMLTRGLSALRSFMRGGSVKARAPARAPPSASASFRAGAKGAKPAGHAPPPLYLLEEESAPQFCFDPVSGTYKRTATQSPSTSGTLSSYHSHGQAPRASESPRGSVGRMSLPRQESSCKRGQRLSAVL